MRVNRHCSIILPKEVYAEDRCLHAGPNHATDPLTSYIPAVLADTVGFISHLPHRLIEAFRATLEEASHSALLLHVIDAADEERQRNIEQVKKCYKRLAGDLPQLKIYNKIDLLEKRGPRIERNDQGGYPLPCGYRPYWWRCWAIIWGLAECLGERIVCGTLCLPACLSNQLAKLRARFYDYEAVEQGYQDDGGCHPQISIPRTELLKILGSEEISEAWMVGTAPNLESHDSF